MWMKQSITKDNKFSYHGFSTNLETNLKLLKSKGYKGEIIAKTL